MLTLKSRGNTLAGWPLMTKRRELSFRRLASRSSKHWRRNLMRSDEEEVEKEGREQQMYYLSTCYTPESWSKHWCSSLNFWSFSFVTSLQNVYESLFGPFLLSSHFSARFFCSCWVFLGSPSVCVCLALWRIWPSSENWFPSDTHVWSSNGSAYSRKKNNFMCCLW